MLQFSTRFMSGFSTPNVRSSRRWSNINPLPELLGKCATDENKDMISDCRNFLETRLESFSLGGVHGTFEPFINTSESIRIPE